MQGLVHDTTQGRLPGVTLTLRNLATNILRTAVSGEAGEYRFDALEPGDYELAADLAGFTLPPQSPLRLQVGDVLAIPIEMRPATLAETVVVVAAAPVLEPSRTAVATVIETREIEDLPLNGRRVTDLAALTAGVTADGPADPAAETSGLSVLGQRPVSNSLLVDGLDNNDRVLGGATASFTQESIREFRVVTASYPAEFGNATGGVINIVTRSGTNRVRGGGFIYYRDQALNSRGYFERFDALGNRIDLEKAPFSQAQFGGTLGGPLQRNRTFAFTALERTETRASNFVTIDPSVAALLTGGGWPVLTGHVGYESTLTQAMARVDRYWTPASSLALRFQLANANNENYVPFGGLTAWSRGAVLDRRDWGVAASQTDVFAGGWIHDARAQIVRQRHEVTPNDTTGPALSLLGIAEVGRSTLYPTDRTNWTWQLKDTITRVAGAHTIKAGADFTHIDQQALLSYTFGGSYVFAELPAIPGLLLRALSPTESLLAGLPALYVQGYGDGNSPFDYTEASAFVQDDWQIGGRITLKGGLRYQRQTFPDFDVTVSDLDGATLSYPYPLSGDHLSPRAALAWNPTAGGRTVIHGAYGLFFGEQLTSIYGLTSVFGRTGGTRVAVHPFPSSLVAWQFPGRQLPEGFLPAPSATITVAPGAGTPRVHQMSVGISRDFGRGFAASVDAVYSHGSHQLGALDYNPIVPALGPGRRPNDIGAQAGTSTSSVRYTDFGETWYRGVLVSVRHAGDRRDLRLSYTWSLAEDNAARFTGLVNDNGRGRNPLDPDALPVGFDPATEKGPADTDQRHRLVLSGTYSVPGAVDISGILSAASGLPYTPLAGADLNGDGLPDADRARQDVLDPTTAVGRNSERLPAHITVDLRVSRALRLGSKAALTPILDVFNLFNRTNVSEVNAIFGTGNYPGDPRRDAQGRITFGRTQKTLAPRQIQLAARLSF